MNIPELADYLFDAYEKVGAYGYDFVCIYSDFRGLAQSLAPDSGKKEICRMVVDPLLDRGATVLVPTFTYTTEGEFEVLETPTKLGVLGKWLLEQDGFCRSEHPLFSYAALGPEAGFLENIGKSAFGADSVCARLRKRNSLYLHVGRPTEIGNTSVHHVEQMCGATYRSHKAFATKVYRNGDFIGTDYTAFLKRRDVPNRKFDFTFETATSAMREAGIIRSVGNRDDLTIVDAYDCDNGLRFLESMFYENQNIFLNNPFVQY